MNTLLDTTGAFLYFILSIILLPLFLLVQALIFSVTAYRITRSAYRQWMKRMEKQPYRLQRIDLAVKRGWVYLMPNRH